MSTALSLDLRVRVLAAIQGGATHRDAAERLGVSAASMSRWRIKETRVRRRWGRPAVGAD
jgi:transposase-like protein